MDIRCVNSKSYALTVGRVYEDVEKVGKTMVRVTNDRGTSSKYSMDLFEEVIEEVQLSDEDILNTYRYMNRTSSIELNGNRIDVCNEELVRHGTNISCGIADFTNISTLAETIHDFIRNNNLSKDIARELFKRHIIDECKSQSGSSAMVILSTNIANEVHDDDSAETHELAYIYKILNEISVSTIIRYNENSGNLIALWVLTEATDYNSVDPVVNTEGLTDLELEMVAEIEDLE